MKKTIMKLGMFCCVGAILASCGQSADPTPTPQEVNFVDNRQDLFQVVSGEMENGEFVPDGETKDFKSIYEAANYLFDNCEFGSYIKKIGDETNTILFQKRADVESVQGQTITDQWFYYRDGSMLDGYSQYIAGDTEFFKNQNVSRFMVNNDGLKQTYQPYGLLKRDATSSTNSWNLLTLMDTSIRYNPVSFSGIREITFDFALSNAKIRPSYSKEQKVIPTITLSQTDSYNWSNQGIWMDTETGNWYYLKGETQAEVKELEYDKEEVILTSTWDNEKQEWTPNGDVKMKLTYVFNADEEIWTNDLDIDVKTGEEVKSFKKTYEYSKMNGRGTPRASIALDLVSTDEDIEEGAFAPDYMCGAYFKNIIVKDAFGKVPEGLTDDEYGGDSEMVCEAGKTYDLTVGGEKNAADVEVILDHNAAITFDETNKEDDVYSISYEQNISEKLRDDKVLAVEKLISAIKDTDTKDSPAVVKAAAEFNKLEALQQKVVTSIDGYRQLQIALGK